MGLRESSDSHRYIDRGGRCFTSVGLAQARPNKCCSVVYTFPDMLHATVLVYTNMSGY